MKRRLWMAAVLSLMLTLAACGEKAEPAPQAPVTPDTQVEEPVLPAPEEETPAEPEKDPAPVPLQVLVSRHSDSEVDLEEDYTLLCSTEWNSIALGEKSAAAFPALDARLWQINRENTAFSEQIMEQMLPDAREAAVDDVYFQGFTSSSDYLVCRADDRILSVRVEESEYTGGVHPMYWVMGMNLDPATGEELALTDVLTDTRQLAPILTDKIREKYPDVHTGSLPEMLGEYRPEQFSWTLDYQGITFYFSPYEIASYADGLLTAVIWFDEMPELFHPRYTAAPAGGWARELPMGYGTQVDLKQDDGERDSLHPWAYEEEYGHLALTVELNGEPYRLDDCYGYEMIPFLVCLEEEGEQRYFLYIEATAENDYTTLFVYALNEEGMPLSGQLSGAGFAEGWLPTQDDEGIWFREVFNDPTGVELNSIIQCVGTWVGSRIYCADFGTGLLKTQDRYYTLDPDIRYITSAVALEVTLLPGEEKETLPAGTHFYYRRTDGESVVLLELEDGRECRIDIVREDYVPLINGIPEWDCFEDLVYAG